jgi:hypothetical protein
MANRRRKFEADETGDDETNSALTAGHRCQPPEQDTQQSRSDSAREPEDLEMTCASDGDLTSNDSSITDNGISRVVETPESDEL